MNAERGRLIFAILLSLQLHALLLSLFFAGQGIGLPGFAFPWQKRLAQAPDLRVMLMRSAVAAPAGSLYASPEQQVQTDPAPGSPPVAAAQSSEALAAPIPQVAVIALERSDEPAFLVPPPPPAAPVPRPTQPKTLQPRNEAEVRRVETAEPEPVVKEDDAATREAERLAEQREAARAATQQEAERREAARLAEAKLEAQKREDARQAAARLEAVRLEAERREAARLAEAKLTAQKQEESRQAEARIEAQKHEDARQAAARAEAARLETERREAARLAEAKLEARKHEDVLQAAARSEAARLETERRETARLAMARLEAQKREDARLAAARTEANRLEAERRETARLAAAKLEARKQEEREEDERRLARRQAMGRQLDEEAARRDAAASAAPSRLPRSLSTARRVRLWGRTDPNVELVEYAEAWARRIQLNTPVEAVSKIAKRPHTQPMVIVALRSDGSVESISFVTSSGIAEIDEAIRRIVLSHAPYPAFPPGLARQYDVVEIRRTWQFDSAVRLY